jgi:hypothetical protein
VIFFDARAQRRKGRREKKPSASLAPLRLCVKNRPE